MKIMHFLNARSILNFVLSVLIVIVITFFFIIENKYSWLTKIWDLDVYKPSETLIYWQLAYDFTFHKNVTFSLLFEISIYVSLIYLSLCKKYYAIALIKSISIVIIFTFIVFLIEEYTGNVMYNISPTASCLHTWFWCASNQIWNLLNSIILFWVFIINVWRK